MGEAAELVAVARGERRAQLVERRGGGALEEVDELDGDVAVVGA